VSVNVLCERGIDAIDDDEIKDLLLMMIETSLFGIEDTTNVHNGVTLV
jgi:hypothetical protein